jgi:hypothetical protein
MVELAHVAPLSLVPTSGARGRMVQLALHDAFTRLKFVRGWRPTAARIETKLPLGSSRMGVWGLSKKAAHYRPAQDADARCEHCKYMFPPLAIGGCRFVRGVIRGSATCDEFMPRRRT